MNKKTTCRYDKNVKRKKKQNIKLTKITKQKKARKSE